MNSIILLQHSVNSGHTPERGRKHYFLCNILCHNKLRKNFSQSYSLPNSEMQSSGAFVAAPHVTFSGCHMRHCTKIVIVNICDILDCYTYIHLHTLHCIFGGSASLYGLDIQLLCGIRTECLACFELG